MTQTALRPKTKLRASCIRGVALLLTVILSAACTVRHRVNVLAVPALPTPGAHGFAVAFLDVCTRMGWTATCNDPTYTDDQRLRVSATEYGPHAYIAPAPTLGDHDQDADFLDPKLVAIVYVKPEQIGPGGLSPSYTDLKLTGGSSCVYIRYVAPDFQAYVVPQTSGNCATTYVPNPTHRVDAHGYIAPDEWGAGTEAERAARIPAVARFHEGAGMRGTSERFMLGMRCGSRWCFLRPAGSPAFVIPAAHFGQHEKLRTWSVPGWFDAQRLAVPNAVGTLVPSTLEASIIPDGELATNTWRKLDTEKVGKAHHAATIYFGGSPFADYQGKWRLRKGRNELYIWKDAADKWHGEIHNKRWTWLGRRTFITPVFVDRRHDGLNPPATARFRWSANDEDAWIACDGGCCYVSAFQ